jgi:Tol biopolymer transport system component
MSRARILAGLVVVGVVVVGVVVYQRTTTSDRRPDLVTGVGGEQGCPSWSPDGRRIVYASGDHWHNQVWVANAASGQSHAIAVGSDPVWAPDGNAIALVRHGQLVVVSPSGHERRGFAPLRASFHEPDWSPDGDTIAVRADSKADLLPRLAFADANTGRIRVTSRYPVYNPAFAPDGRHIVYDTNDDIVIAAVDGAAPQVVFHRGGFSATGPSWSPDGARIAFAAGGIYVDTPATGETTKLTTPDSTRQLTDACPAWSTDGHHIAFQRLHSYSVGLETATDSAIVLIDANGNHEHLLGGN